MAPKRKRQNDSESVRAFDYTFDDLSDSETRHDLSQTNVMLRARHDDRGRSNTQTTHMSVNADEEPDLEALYAALIDDTESQLSTSYGGEDLVSPLEHDLPSNIIEHQIPEDENRSTARPVQEWVQHQQEFLDEFIRADGLGESGQVGMCESCGENEGLFMCRDCFGQAMHCRNCVCAQHAFLPLHRLRFWNQFFFESVSLQELGLEVHLGHGGLPCPRPLAEVKNFTVVDLSGVHSVHLSYCGCLGSPERRVQLLRQAWFPASMKTPETAFTFDLLNTFHLLNLQSKTALYDFWNAIRHKSDNSGTRETKDRYDQLLTATRIWRHLKLVKRAGCGHNPAGVAATKQGECAVECAACPHPGINLPPDWEKAPVSVRWLYALVLTIDANFRLKLKEKGYADDPPLGDGWSHFVVQKAFKDYVTEWGWQIEPNLCDSSLSAADHGTTKKKTVFAASGVGGVICNHTLVRRNGMADLWKGERFAFMDFIVFSTLLGVLVTALTLSYDICCQWSRNLKSRIPQFPPNLRAVPMALLKKIKFVIPKFHLHNHGLNCHLNYNLNFLRWSAQSDLEDPERWWAHINPISMSTREMTAGARIDILNDHAAGWNWRKTTGFGQRFYTRLEIAIDSSAKHRKAFEDFDKLFPSAIVKGWNDKVKAWDANPSKPNPYAEPLAETSMAEVLLELAREEDAATTNGDQVLTHKISPVNFLKQGLHLEERQRELAALFKEAATTTRKTELLGQRHSLRYQITKWREIQAIYMPGVARLLEADAAGSPTLTHPEVELLYLPSSISSDIRHSCCIPGLPNWECRVRLGQADDALNEVRRQLRITSSVIQFKRGQHQASQQLSRKSKALMTKFTNKTNRAGARYITAYTALCTLDPEGSWADRLKPLDLSKDLHLPRREDDDGLDDDEKELRRRGGRFRGRRQGENQRELSWIWRAQHVGGRPSQVTSVDEVNETMQVEWAKTKARSDRWAEDYLLTVEQMRRVIAFLDWKAGWWIQRASIRTDTSSALHSGLRAYAHKQAFVCQDLARSFARKWYPLLIKNSIPIEWPQAYIPVST